MKKKKNIIPSHKKPSQKNNSFSFKHPLLFNTILVLSIIIITFIVFYPSLKNGFTNWDDPGYVTENNLITQLNAKTIKYIFSHFVMSNYHPITMISIAVDYHFAKLNPFQYHFVNIIFHLLNSILVFILIYRISNKKWIVAFVVTLLFSLHPMHVESVTWISGRKDVLFSFFFLLGLITYYSYLKIDKNKLFFYFISFISFLLSCLSKPAAITFPLIILLFDFYTNRKFTFKSGLEKIPFFVVSFIFGVLTIQSQKEGAAISAWDTMQVHYRIMFASYGFITYILKFLIPFQLSAFYPYPVKFPIQESLPFIYYAAPFIVIGLFYVAYKLLKYSKNVAFGLLFYFLNIALVLQFVSVGASIMSERYTYLPYIGLAFIAGMELDRFYTNTSPSLTTLKKIFVFVLVIYGLIFSSITYKRTKIWKNNETLWSDVIKKYPEKVDLAYKNRGNYYAREVNNYEKALQDYNTFIKINPYDASIFSNRGNLYGLMKQFELSLADYSRALLIDSTHVESYINRAVTYMAMKKYDLALIDINKGILLNPEKLSGYKNRAYCYVNMLKNEEAIQEYNFLIKKQPDDYSHYFFRGIAYFNSKNYNNALVDFTKSIEINSTYAESYTNRSQTYKILGDYKNALNDVLKAKELGIEINNKYVEELQALIK